MIFDESLKERPVRYALASSVLNNDGEFYAEYGCHDETYQIDAIFYEGYRGCKVFAYLGFPKSDAAQKSPAMVLVHGGIGKAEISWVKKWNDRGIAAIAMDLYGDGPEDDPDNPYGTGKKKHPYAGLCPWSSFPATFSPDYENAEMYQNVYHVISAVNLLIHSGRIDPQNIGITGISWGGITTAITAGVDDRLKFAIPVYGCGFLHECRTYFHAAYEQGGDCAWDPARHASQAQFPILLINGDDDGHFSLNATSHTYETLKNGYISIHHGLIHSQEQGDSIPQVYHFAEHLFFGKHDFVQIKGYEVFKERHVLRLDLEHAENCPPYRCVLYYLTTQELGFGGQENMTWYSSHSCSRLESGVEMDIPQEAKWFYVSLEDENGNMFSTKLIKADEYEGGFIHG